MVSNIFLDKQITSLICEEKIRMMYTLYNLFGITLAELCCTFDIHIINGRLFNDSDGNFTCIANDGASVVDYSIASSKLFFLTFHTLRGCQLSNIILV